MKRNKQTDKIFDQALKLNPLDQYMQSLKCIDALTFFIQRRTQQLKIQIQCQQQDWKIMILMLNILGRFHFNLPVDDEPIIAPFKNQNQEEEDEATLNSNDPKVLLNIQSLFQHRNQSKSQVNNTMIFDDQNYQGVISEVLRPSKKEHQAKNKIILIYDLGDFETGIKNFDEVLTFLRKDVDSHSFKRSILKYHIQKNIKLPQNAMILQLIITQMIIRDQFTKVRNYLNWANIFGLQCVLMLQLPLELFKVYQQYI